VTNQPQGRDGTSPSVAALAIRVNELRREAEALAAKVNDLGSTQRQHAVLLEGLAELRRQIDRILSTLAEQDEDAPATWFWLTMSEQERDEKFAELTDWVETVLRIQYPNYLAGRIRSCWPNHPEAIWELAWLYQQWSLTYLAEHGAVRDAADWHDRWSPGVIFRLATVMGRCADGCAKRSLRESQDTRP
jgi:hypothetical protein